VRPCRIRVLTLSDIFSRVINVANKSSAGNLGISPFPETVSDYYPEWQKLLYVTAGVKLNDEG
jgi:hypothetical protein